MAVRQLREHHSKKLGAAGKGLYGAVAAVLPYALEKQVLRRVINYLRKDQLAFVNDWRPPFGITSAC